MNRRLGAMNYSRWHSDPERYAQEVSLRLSRAKIDSEMNNSRRSYFGLGGERSDNAPSGYARCGHCDGKGVCERGIGKWSCSECMSKVYVFKRDGRTVKCNICKGFGWVKLEQ
jgi:hypothetical protein